MMLRIKELNTEKIAYQSPKILLWGLLLAITLVQIYPLIFLLLFSLKDNAEIFGGNVLGFPRILRWDNYSDAITNGKVGIYFINSVIVTAFTILLTSIFGCTSGYAIVRMRWKLSRPILILFLLGLMIPVHAALLPLFLVLRTLCILNSHLALIIPYTAFSLPMVMFILTGFFQSIPKEMEESACIDGCSIYRAFFSIILPLVKPALATAAIFTYIFSWNELMFAVTFISKAEYKTLTVGIMSMVGLYVTKWGPIGAGLVVATIPTIVVYLLMSRQVQKSLTAGAIKG
jgi:raffinose/stachyose/melibiose transport system permease protein